METKSASRSLKKNANTGPGTAGDRKKAKQKKKKEKRKQSLKGTESTDIPSPELDSEVPFDGDATLTDQGEGERSSAGQVTKLPHLIHSAVSLTTQVLPTDTASSTTTTNNTASTSTSLRKLQLGQASSAPTLRTSQPIASNANSRNDSSSTTTAPTTTTSTTNVATTTPGVDGVVARVASLTIKQRSSKPRSKTQSKASSKASRTRERQNNAANKHNSNASNSAAGGGGSGSNNHNGGLSTSTTAKTVCSVINESLRWEYVLEDVEKERERIALYKLNRRKRYLAAAQAKGLRWAMNYNTHIAVSPMSEDSGVDTTYGSSAAYLDFAPMTSLRPMPAHRGLQEAFVEC